MYYPEDDNDEEEAPEAADYDVSPTGATGAQSAATRSLREPDHYNRYDGGVLAFGENRGGGTAHVNHHGNGGTSESDYDGGVYGGYHRATSAVGDDGESQADQQAAYANYSVQDCHVNQMPGYDQRLLGFGIQPKAPTFYQLPGHGWSSFNQLYKRNASDEIVDAFVPVRSMCINIPIEVFSNDAVKFRDWCTPRVNALRATNLAVLISMIYVPLSKGWL